MKKILVITDNNPNRSARPERLLSLLANSEYETHLLSQTSFNSNKINHFKLSKKMTNWEGFIYIFSLYKIYNKLLNLNPIGNNVFNKLNNNKYDLIICENLTVIYYAFLFKKSNTKIMLDLREFYVNQYDNDFHSHFIKKIYYNSKIKYLNYLLNNYASKCDKLITVSPGLEENYKRVFNFDCDLIMSLPKYEDNKSKLLANNNKIKLVHHGGAKEARKIELMIELMDYLDADKFELDLYLIKYHNDYYEFLKDLIKNKNNINIYKEIDLNKINDTLINYDVGLIMFEPTTFNLEYSLPNKLFEFIQAGLCVVSYPLPNIKSVINEYNSGYVSENYDIKEIANKLNNLSIEEINKYKLNSISASKVLNAKENNKKLTEIIKEMVE